MLEKILIISFIVMLIWHSYGEGEIFGWLGDWFGKVLPKAIHKPIFDCSVCMGVWYGIAIYWAGHFLLHWQSSWKECVFVVIAAAGFNAIIVRLWPEK